MTDSDANYVWKPTMTFRIFVYTSLLFCLYCFWIGFMDVIGSALDKVINSNSINDKEQYCEEFK